MAVWINEFHYDNTGTDAGEFIEVAGAAGTDLSGWSLVLYNGNPTQRTVYSTINLSGIIDNESNGFGALSFSLPVNGLQNGGFPGTDVEPDGIVLFDGTSVVQFLSYEGSAATGTFTAANGVAAGQTSVNIGIGIAEAGTEPLGLSLQLTGTGDAYAEFAWGGPVAQSAGSLNAGQIIPAPVVETVTINDVSVTEGNAGTTLLTFTVTRSGNTGAFTIDFETQDGTATLADSDYVANSGQLSFTAGGVLSQQISVTVNGDTTAEADQALTVLLSSLTNISGTTVLGDASGTGTILNDDIAFTEIGTIQGAGHKAPSVGGAVSAFGNSGTTRFNVEGVVTAITTNGFWIQDADGDGNTATSDGIFVFTSSAPAGTITVGETVQLLNVQVNEFRLSSAPNNLTVTQLTASTGTLVELGGSTVVTPVVLGTDRIIPTGTIEDDGFTSFDIATDAIDFWESLEGMLVTVPESIATEGTNRFRTRDPANSANAEGPPTEEIWVRIPSNTDPADITPNGGLIIGAGDFNPERIQIDDLTSPVAFPDVNVGDTVGPVTGVVGYDFGNYEVLTATAPTVTAGAIQKEVTAITRDARQVTVGSYNVLNLDPEDENTSAWGTGGVGADGTGGVDGSTTAGNQVGDLYGRLGNADDDIGSGQYARVAFDIAVALGAPTIVALQEIQDNDGAEISGILAADVTLQTLVDLISLNHGIDYDFVEVAPGAGNINGGQPNANIRNAFLYRADQVDLLNAFLLDPANPAFADSRKPLVGEFEANGVAFTVVNNHFASKSGDTPLFGNSQPPVLNSEAERVAQAQVVNDYVDSLLTADPAARIVVTGDLNDFAFSAPFTTLTGTGAGQVLFDLAEELLPTNEQYNYIFEGNSQDLDHILVSEALRDEAEPAYDVVRRNAEFADQTSDHDPLLARFDFRAFDEVLRGTDLADLIEGLGGDDSINTRGGNDTLVGGAGDDTLQSGGGKDVFVFGPDGGTDQVKGFTQGKDLLDFAAFAPLGVDGIEDLDIVTFASGTTRITVDAAPGVVIRLTLNGAVLDADDFIFA
jgi:hypothetical protein